MVSADHDWIDGGITAVPGILAAGLHAGIKPAPARDLALVYSATPATAAGLFTTNRIVGAPVKVTRERLRSGVAQAIVASSGCSNVATGEQGIRDAREMTEIVAKHLRIPDERVLVASTGVIGRYLPMERIRPALPKLVKGLTPEGSRSAAEGIMTTDTHPKEAALRVEIGGRRVTIGAIAKGTGMIHPTMATMFCFVATDLAVEREGLQGAIRRAVTGSFNRISVDGDRSTSDTVIILANGLAENRPLARGDRRLRPFQQALDALTQRLAVMLVKDGEGATVVIDVRVRGAKTRGDAEKAARSIANSNLFKTAMAGRDPNWGRVMSALGAADIAVQEDRVAVWYGEEQVAAGGRLREGVRWDRVKAELARPEVTVTVDLGLGSAQDHIWTCDLTADYVKINTGTS
ncbi:MAG TPA: bifunctional glutamate N-acetyltransferase/amino-acid acetyltransferase ArgJ [Methylomirabilota bacterium]|jgi:glutamate N-acetyltransferase/amino-acid N-acetyltransferase|nr:bifunctional glutamate N-acetyltransferase/amino-acid acetyltransferase ArgJ [Methylomirabilota bacterium]